MTEFDVGRVRLIDQDMLLTFEVRVTRSWREVVASDDPRENTPYDEKLSRSY